MNKTIKINPSLLELSKKEKKQKSVKNSIKPTSLKKKLLQKIKNHRKSRERDIRDKEKNNSEKIQENKSIKSSVVEEKTFENEFNKSMNYLSNIISEKKNGKIKKKTKKKDFDYDNTPVNIGLPPQLSNEKTMPQETEIQIEIKPNKDLPNEPTVIINNKQPQYGCLKNGKMPTYKNWKKKQTTETLNNYKPPSIQFIENKNEPQENNKVEKQEKINQPITFRQKRLEEIKEKIQKNNMNNKKETLTNTNEKENNNGTTQNNGNTQNNVKTETNVKNKTLKKRVKIGKVSDSQITVLIKNQKTRKLNESEKNDIEKTKLSDMKTELKKNGLIKPGSNAPPDIIREIYTSAKLSGNVENTNNKTMLDSFLSDER
jgi:hypothetical protein